jgi:hypothetical protein
MVGYSLALSQDGQTTQHVGSFLHRRILLILFHAVGTVLSYVFYWLAAIVTLVALKWREGRLRVFGLESAAGKARRLRQTADTSAIHEDVPPLVNPTGQISELPK